MRVSTFSGRPQDYEDFYAELLSEKVEDPSLFITEFENEGLSLASNDSLEKVDLQEVRDREMEVFRRPFVGSYFPVLEENFHFALQLPNSFNFRSYFEKEIGPAVESALRSVGVDDPVSYGGYDDLSVRVGGKPIAGINERNSKSSVYAGFVAVEAWDSEMLGSILDLREGEAGFIDEMPSLEAYGVSGSKEFREEFIRHLSAYPVELEEADTYTLDGGWDEMGSPSSELSYAGFCPVTGETLSSYSESSR